MYQIRVFGLIGYTYISSTKCLYRPIPVNVVDCVLCAGVEIGTVWQMRLECSAAGVHRLVQVTRMAHYSSYQMSA